MEPPRVDIRFIEGSRAGETLPLTVAMVGPFAGETPQPSDDKIDFLTVPAGTLDAALARFRPKLTLDVGLEDNVVVQIRALGSFRPNALLRCPSALPLLIPALMRDALSDRTKAPQRPTDNEAEAELRSAINALAQDPLDEKSSTEEMLGAASAVLKKQLQKHVELLDTENHPWPKPHTPVPADITRLCRAFVDAWLVSGMPPSGTDTDIAWSCLDAALSTVAIETGEPHAIALILSGLDAEIERRLHRVLADPKLRRLERAWRCADLVHRAARGNEDIKLKLLAYDPDHFLEDLRQQDAVENTLFYRLAVNDAYQQFGGDPLTLFVVLDELTRSSAQETVLRNAAEIASMAHCIVLLDAAPGLLGLGSFDEFGAWTESILADHEYLYRAVPSWWHTLREEPNARFLAVCLPPLVARRPYRAEDWPALSMIMDEGGAGSEPLMIPAAAGLAALTVKSFLRYGWPVAITGILSGDGRLDLIDTAGFSFDPYPAGARSPLAYQITERLEELLQASGFVAFTSTPFLKDPVLTSAPSMQRPQERPTRRRDEQGQREAEELVSRLPYTLAVTRFAHFIKVMMREEIGTRKEAADIEMMCNSWLGEYVVWQSDAPVEIRAERPLRRASVSVEPTDVPGFSKVSMKLQPHYQVAVVDYEVSLTTDIQVATGENLRGKADGA